MIHRNLIGTHIIFLNWYTLRLQHGLGFCPYFFTFDFYYSYWSLFKVFLVIDFLHGRNLYTNNITCFEYFLFFFFKKSTQNLNLVLDHGFVI